VHSSSIAGAKNPATDFYSYMTLVIEVRCKIFMALRQNFAFLRLMPHLEEEIIPERVWNFSCFQASERIIIYILFFSSPKVMYLREKDLSYARCSSHTATCEHIGSESTTSGVCLVDSQSVAATKFREEIWRHTLWQDLTRN
jgi:hypothetical protein